MTFRDLSDDQRIDEHAEMTMPDLRRGPPGMAPGDKTGVFTARGVVSKDVQVARQGLAILPTGCTVDIVDNVDVATCAPGVGPRGQARARTGFQPPPGGSATVTERLIERANPTTPLSSTLPLDVGVAADNDERDLTDVEVDALLRNAGVDIDKALRENYPAELIAEMRDNMRRIHRRQSQRALDSSDSEVDYAVGEALGQVVLALRWRNLDHCVDVVEGVAADLGVRIHRYGDD